MLNGQRVSRVFESFKAGKSNHKGRTGAAGFVSMVTDHMGLTYDRFGRKRVSETIETKGGMNVPRMRPEELGLKELAESMVGSAWVQSLKPGSGDHGLEVLEAGEGAIQPGHFPNISAYSATISGLLEIKVLEAYQTPAFVADQLVKTISTKQRSEKLPGLGRIGDTAENMTPGQAHPRVQFGERYVTTPETTKRGLAIDVTRESVFFDLTNEVLTHAETIGMELGLRKEKLVLRTVSGVDNTYQYNGSSYNTYLTSGNWINDHVNIMVDWTDLNAARILASRMTDQESGERILVMLDTVLCTDYLTETANYIASATQNQQNTNSDAERRMGSNRESGRWKTITSPILEQILTDADGGNLSSAAAQDRWFYLEAQGAFAYMENWAMTTERASASEYTMADHGLVLSVFVDEMGIPAVLEPRKAIRNKQS